MANLTLRLFDQIPAKIWSKAITHMGKLLNDTDEAS